MIKEYTVRPTPLGRECGMVWDTKVVCNIVLEPDNGQGMAVDKCGNLIFTVDNNDVVMFAAGTWSKVTSN